VYAGTPYDLINAVNALRAASGLPPYSINSILMNTAQSQADFMAATGNVTHSGPGGIGLTDRLLAAGYPLAGDISLGGFRAENITGGGESMPAQNAIDHWTGDALHLNTMLSPNLTEIGAGVSISNGRVYYVIDCARPTTSGAPQVSTTDVGGGTAVPAGEAPIPVAIVNTPNSDGDVIHEVKYGQTLWQIAIAYEVKIDDIRRLNNIFGNDIYPGNKLLVKRGVILATASPTESSTPETMVTSIVTATSTPIIIPLTYTSTSIPTSTPSSASGNNSTVMGIAIGIIALALLGGGIFTWIGSSKKEQ
jgi:LysM repeat protein